MTNLGRPPKIVRQVAAVLDEKQLEMDLEYFRDRTISEGARSAAVIKKEDIVFNPEIVKKVREDISYPSVHWPLDYPKDDLKEAIEAYQWGIFFRIQTDDHMPAYGGGPIPDKTHRKLYFKIYEIVTDIESTAFYMGYHLAMGLASGNCRSVFCADEKRCQPMLKGRACIRPNVGRPSMEAIGIDALSMAKKLNWEIPENALCPILSGLILIV